MPRIVTDVGARRRYRADQEGGPGPSRSRRVRHGVAGIAPFRPAATEAADSEFIPHDERRPPPTRGGCGLEDAVDCRTLGLLHIEGSRNMQVQGITWHAVALEKDEFSAMKKLAVEVFGLTPLIEQEGWTLFPMANGTLLDLYARDAIPDYGFNDGIVFGFRVDDIEVASTELAAAGCELLGEIV